MLGLKLAFRSIPGRDLSRRSVGVTRGTAEKGGGSSVNATALLVTSEDRAFGKRGEGQFQDMVVICIFFLLKKIFFWREGVKNKEESKILKKPRGYMLTIVSDTADFGNSVSICPRNC